MNSEKKRRWFSKKTYVILGSIVGIPLLIFLVLTFLGKIIINAELRSRRFKIGEIAKAYSIYYFKDGKIHPLETNPGDTAHSAAFILAQEVNLTDASSYFDEDFSLLPKVIPRSVLRSPSTLGSKAQLNPEFMNSTLCVVIVANLPPNAPPATTPIAWTRGLLDDGSWAPDSPWKGEYGQIAYLDSHVEWEKRFSSVKYGTTIPTTNIREALPPGAVILSAEPAKKGP